MKILLDPLIYWFKDDDNRFENLQYWDKVTSIVEKYFDIKYVSSKTIIQSLMRLNKEPFKFYKEYGDLKQQLVKRMYKNLDYPNNIVEPDITLCILPNGFKVTDDEFVNDSFTRVLNFVKSYGEECMLFLSLANQKSKIGNDENVFVVKHISGELDSKITELITNRLYLKDGIETPTIKNPLPLGDLCDHFLELQDDLKKIDSNMSVFWRVTKEVALRNFYTYDEIATNKNTSDEHKRKIYTYNKNHYISADFESGCFELCDHRGKHKGEISYTGDELSSRDNTGKHDIII